jgi:Tol biopolymer transport system component
MRIRSTLRHSLATVPILLVLLAGCSGKDDQPVAPGPDCDGFNLIAFASDRDQAPGQTDLYLYDLDLNAFRGLPGVNTTAPERQPTLSFDRRTLAFVGSRGTVSDDILLYNRCTAIVSNLPEIASAANESDPAFSGDGHRLAFARDTTSGWRLRLFNGQTLALIRLPALDSLAAALGPYDDRNPAPDQTANRIAFSSNRGGNRDVWVYDRSGDSLLDLPELRSAGDDDEPSLTPDGSFLAFASNRSGGVGGWDIYLFDLRSRTFVTNVPGLNSASDDRDPALWRDGSLIVFPSTRPGGKGGEDLWSYNVATHVILPLSLASSPGADLQPVLASP